MEGVQLMRNNRNELHEDIKCNFPTRRIGNYNIVDYLGWGEQGTALLLEDRLGNKHIGKVFEGSFNLSKYKKAQKNLARGIEISKSLHHSGIPEYHDMVERKDEKQFVVIREYVEGKSLENLMKEEGHLSVEEVRPILEGALECLEYLQNSAEHPEVGVVCHRDINPRHIIVGSDGKVSLIDLDTLKDSESGATQLTSVGTKKYAHPNALIGEASPAYDIFSLGFSIVEAILGNIPEEMDKSRMYGGEVYELPEWVDSDLRSVLNKMINPYEEHNAKEIRDLLNGIDDLEEITELNLERRSGFPDFFEGENKEYLEDLWSICADEIKEKSFVRKRKHLDNPYDAFNHLRAGYIRKVLLKYNAVDVFNLFNEKGLNDINQERRFEISKKILDEVSFQLDQYLVEKNYSQAREEIKELIGYIGRVKNPAYKDISRNNLLKNVELTSRDKEVLELLPLELDLYWKIKDLEKNFEENIEREANGKKVKNSWTSYVSSFFSLSLTYVDRYKSKVKEISQITKQDDFNVNSLEKRLNRYRKLAGFNEEHKPYVAAMRKLGKLR